MATIVLLNIAQVPAGGTYTEYSGLTFSSGTLTKIAGVLDTNFGRYLQKTGNGINGGVPNQGPLSFTLFVASTSTVPAGGTYTEFSGLTFSTGTLTKIAGVLDTTLGRFQLPKIARGLIGVATPPSFGTPVIIFIST